MTPYFCLLNSVFLFKCYCIPKWFLMQLTPASYGLLQHFEMPLFIVISVLYYLYFFHKTVFEYKDYGFITMRFKYIVLRGDMVDK